MLRTASIVGYAALGVVLTLILLFLIDRISAEIGLTWLRVPPHRSSIWRVLFYGALIGIIARGSFNLIDRVVGKWKRQRNLK